MTSLAESLPTLGMSFEYIIKHDLLYIDKTELVARLARQYGAFFLARPRRFGKSLLVSTFKELFANGKESFKGLNLEKEAPWVEKAGAYKVLHLDLSDLCDVSPVLSFEEDFISLLKNKFKDLQVPWGDDPVWKRNLENALNSCEGQSLVLLIDEHDSPLTHTLTDPDEFEERRRVLTLFFTIVKMFTDKFRFIFITGITKFTGISSFSGLNNLEDITFDADYGAITGITQKELETCCKPYIRNAAQVFNEKYPGRGWDEEKILSEMKANYDGYSFDRQAKTRVYNPWSVLHFLKKPQNKFLPYWLQSGGTAALLAHYIKKMSQQGRGLGELVDCFNKDRIWYSDEAELFPSIDNIAEDSFPLFSILYQTGYLTIKNLDDEGDGFAIGFPNGQVKKAFADNVIRILTGKTSKYIHKTYLPLVTEALDQKDLCKLHETFNLFLNRLSYESLSNFDEYMLRDTLFASLQDFEGNAQIEVPTSQGRIDLFIENSKYAYIFQLKVRKDRNEADEALEKAKKQIIDRKYALRLTPKQIVAAALVFINEPQFDKRRSPSRIREIMYLEEVDVPGVK